MVARRFPLVAVALFAMAIVNANAILAEKPSRPDSGLPQAEPTDVGLAAEPLAKIPTRMQKLVDEHRAAGVVSLVAYKGKVVHFSAVGQADVEGDRPMTTDSMFAIASMTKPITGAALMILVDEGKLSLDDPVAKYIPEFKNATVGDKPLARDVTLRDLATHTSGLGGEQRNEGTLAETAVMLARRPLSFQPGEKWQYSPGLSVCGRVVEIVSGQPFEKFLAERIFQPLQMNDTTFFPSPEQQPRIARLYQPGEDGQSLKADHHWLLDLSATTSPNPSGGLFSTADDLVRFCQMTLNGGELDGQRILSKNAVAELTKIHTGDLTTGFTPGNGWGIGWCVVRNPQDVTAMLKPGACGHGGAFGTQGWIDPQQQMVFIMLVQRSKFGNGDASDLRRVVQEQATRALAKSNQP